MAARLSRFATRAAILGHSRCGRTAVPFNTMGTTAPAAGTQGRLTRTVRSIRAADRSASGGSCGETARCARAACPSLASTGGKPSREIRHAGRDARVRRSSRDIDLHGASLQQYRFDARLSQQCLSVVANGGAVKPSHRDAPRSCASVYICPCAELIGCLVFAVDQQGPYATPEDAEYEPEFETIDKATLRGRMVSAVTRNAIAYNVLARWCAAP